MQDALFQYSFSQDKINIFAASDVALAKSGTNTLEIAASDTAMIVAYKLNIFSYFLVRWLIKIRYVSLINIIASKAIIPELIQFDCTSEKISSHLIELLTNADKATLQTQEANSVLQTLGFKSSSSPSNIAAKIIKSEIVTRMQTTR